jgi:uncharacterized protein (DUF488 family)
MMRRVNTAPTVSTIGHSTRSIETFLDLLRAHEVKRVVDVRTIPRSRYNPQFNHDALTESLRSVSMEYTEMKDLGGLRHARPDSINIGWRNASFRGYADYMATPAFDAALARLIKAAQREHVAIMCAEAVPWRCHRSLIADALIVRGIGVQHIMSESRAQPHSLTSFAVVQGTHISYPAIPTGQIDLEGVL